MKNSGVLGREALGERGLSTSANEDVATTEGLNLTSRAVSGLYAKGLNAAGLLLDGGDGDDFVVVLDEMLEPGGAPAEVVLVLVSGRQEGAQVGEVNQAVVSVEVVEESELGSGVSESSEILDERNLHLGSGEEHTGVPGKAGLLLKEEHLGSGAIRAELLASSEGIVHGNGDSQTGRAKTGANQVILGVGGRSLEIRSSLAADLGPGGGACGAVDSSVGSSGQVNLAMGGHFEKKIKD